MDDALTTFVNNEEGTMEAVIEFMDVPQEVTEIVSDPETHEAAIPTEPIEQLADLIAKYEFAEENPISEGFFFEK